MEPAEVTCPYCFQPVTIVVDPSLPGHQEYVEDCEVCCRPWRVDVHVARDGSVSATVGRAQ
jgi:transposase-like protein